MLHVRGERMDRRRLASALQVLQARQLLLHASSPDNEKLFWRRFMSGPFLALLYMLYVLYVTKLVLQQTGTFEYFQEKKTRKNLELFSLCFQNKK